MEDKTLKFLEKLKQKGLFREDYDYSEMVYESHRSVLCIIDENKFKHNIIAVNLLRCENLSIQSAIDKTAYYIHRADIMPEKYDYSLTVYKDSYTEITVIDKEYGEMKVLPNAHLSMLRSVNNFTRKDKLYKKYNFTKNTEDFLDLLKLKNKYNNDYDYSNVDYIDNKTDIIIIDENNIEHKIKPSDILKGVKLTIKTAIDKNEYFKLQSIKIHGILYDYSSVVYIKKSENVTLKCHIHGDFQITPYQHLEGFGCQKCKKELYERTNYYKFINKIKENKLFREDYIYGNGESLSDFNDDIVIRDEHGFEYIVKPNTYIKNGLLDITNTSLFKDYYFIQKTNILYGDEYTVIEYSDLKSLATLKNKNGNIITVLPRDFLSNNFNDKNNIKKIKTNDSVYIYNKENINPEHMLTKKNKPNFRTRKFIEQAKKIHGEDTYDYSLVDYEEATKHVMIFCKKHKTLFRMTPNHHIIGGICPECREDLVLEKRRIKNEKEQESKD